MAVSPSQLLTVAVAGPDLAVIEFPGVVDDMAAALDALGGAAHVAKVVHAHRQGVKPSSRRVVATAAAAAAAPTLTLDFSDGTEPHAHGAPATVGDRTGLLLRVTRAAAPGHGAAGGLLHAECLGTFAHTWAFPDPADFQFLTGKTTRLTGGCILADAMPGRRGCADAFSAGCFPLTVP